MELEKLANLMKISITDLRVFVDEFNGNEKNYKTAEERCNIELLSR